MMKENKMCKQVLPEKRYISPEERQKNIDELRQVPKKYEYFQKVLMN